LLNRPGKLNSFSVLFFRKPDHRPSHQAVPQDHLRAPLSLRPTTIRLQTYRFVRFEVLRDKKTANVQGIIKYA
jgi:hypothetical protein